MNRRPTRSSPGLVRTRPSCWSRAMTEKTRQAAVAKAADQASESWDASRTEFLADLDPGAKHDWVCTALGEPSKHDRLTRQAGVLSASREVV